MVHINDIMPESISDLLKRFFKNTSNLTEEFVEQFITEACVPQEYHQLVYDAFNSVKGGKSNE